MSAPELASDFWYAPLGGIARCGIKGAQAGALLAAHGIAVPDGANSLRPLAAPHRGRCLRLGYTEYLVEQDDGDDLVQALTDDLTGATGKARLALRCDGAFLLGGAQLFPALRQLAAFDFESLPERPDQVVMSLMAGIAVTFSLAGSAQEPALRLWLDPSYTEYFADCLRALGAAALTHPPASPHFKPQGTPA